MTESSAPSAQPPSAPLDLSLVVPVYNEEPNLTPLVEKIGAALLPLGKSFEAVLVDDGSSDGSFRLLQTLAAGRPWLRLVKFKANRGQSAAFAAGFKLARGAVVVTMDADLQNDPADIPKLLAPIGEWDAVCGWREVRQDSWLRRVSSKIANGVRNRLSGETIRDTGCSLKAFRRECLKDIPIFKGMHRFLPTLVKMHGFKVTEVPVSHHPRVAGKSKYGVWNRVFSSFADLLAVRWMKKRHVAYEIESDEGGSTQS